MRKPLTKTVRELSMHMTGPVDTHGEGLMTVLVTYVPVARVAFRVVTEGKVALAWRAGNLHMAQPADGV